jgi:CelD/BcsL family acetyltransferase involved in cellulose biosynthesis
MKNLPSVRVVSDILEFEKLREPWNALLSESAANTIFLTWEWMYSWWNCFRADKQLAIILVEEDSHLIGVAPLHLARRRVFGLLTLSHLEFLGTTEVCTEYTDFILKPGREPEIIGILFDFICAKGNLEWDLVNLVSMKESASTLPLIYERCLQKNKKHWIYDSRQSPYIVLPDSMDKYLASISKKMRWKYKKFRENIETRFSMVLLETQEAKAVHTDFNTIQALHQKRWLSLGGVGSFAQSRTKYLEFQRQVAELTFEKKWLSLLILQIDGKAVAGQYNFHYNGKIYHHSTGFDPDWDDYNVGSMIQFLAVQDAISNKKAGEFDFLRGTEPYKYFWTKLDRRSIDLSIWNSRSIYLIIKTQRELGRLARTYIPRELIRKVKQDLGRSSK